MKKVKLLHHQKSRYPSSVDKDKDYFKKKKETIASQTIRLRQEDNYCKCKDTHTRGYLVSESLAKVEARQVYGEKLVKSATLAFASEVLGKDAASALRKIPFLKTLLQKG